MSNFLLFLNLQSSTVSTNSPTPNPITASTSITSQQHPQQDNGEPPFLAIGTEVSAKYKGAFCEARIQKVERLVKCRVTFKNNLGTAIVIDDNIKGNLRVGASIEAKHPDKNNYLEATISKIIDASQYTVIFDDGDITTLRRTSLCLKSGKHFAESESLDHLPLTNPEHFGNPVSLNSRGSRRRRRRSAYSTTTILSLNSTNTTQFSDNDDNESIDGSGTSVDDEDSSSIVTHQSGSTTTTNYKLNINNSISKDNCNENSLDCGKVICVDYDDKRTTKLKDLWFPGLIVSPTAQENKVDSKENYLVKSFANGRFYQISRKDSKEFTKELANQMLNDHNSSTSFKSAVEKALNYLEKNELPSSWDYETLIGSSSLNENHNDEDDDDNESVSDLESLLDDEDNLDLDDAKSVEEKDRFVAQLYKYMDERGTPINKTPTIWNDDLDLYNLYRLVIKMGGYNRVTNKNGWKTVYNRLLPNNETATQASANQLRLAYKKYLLNFVDFFRKLGCTMVDTCMYPSRTGISRTMRPSGRWRDHLAESSKYDTSNKEKINKRKKSTVTTSSDSNIIEKKEDDKKVISEMAMDEKSKKSSVKKTRKYGRKKFKGVEEDTSNVNGNEPEERYIPNDSDFESDSDNLTATAISKEVAVNIGDRIRVKYGKGKQLKVYEAKVMNLVDNEADDPQKIKYFVHYTGWNTRYDEWIKRNRIVEVVSDKSPKRRGGNKSKNNKGVPLTNEEQQPIVPLKNESYKQEQASTPVVSTNVSVGKRGRPPNASNLKNQEKANLTNEAKIKNEIVTTTINNKKLPAVSPTKRNRQRSECLETAQDENNEQTSIIDQSIKKDEKMEVENNEKQETKEDVSVENKEQDKRSSYKKLKRSNSFKSSNVNIPKKEQEKVEDTHNTDDESTSKKTNVQKVEEDDLSNNRRRQRKKKNDKTPPITIQTEQIATKDEDKQTQAPTASSAAKKRKSQHQKNTCSSDDEDDSNSSSNTAASSNPNSNNKFSKRKRILNSKYRQDNVLVKIESASTSLVIVSSQQQPKETELTRKKSKEENSKGEKSTTNQQDENKQETVKSILPLKNKQPEHQLEKETVVSTTINEPINILLCKEEIPASPICDENNQQSKNSTCTKNSTSDNQLVEESKSSFTSKQTDTSNQTATTTTVNQKESNSGQSSLSNTNTVQTAKSCSDIDNLITATITKKIQPEKQQPTTTKNSTTQSKQTASSSSSSNHNNNSTKTDNLSKKENEDGECVQFTPPTTPESLKSNSTSSSHNDKESNDEKITNDKNENNEQPIAKDQQNKIMETHGLDIIAMASSKLDQMDKQNNELFKKENLDALALNNSFSPRKRRGRGRTSSQSEHTSVNLSSNLFNTSFNNKDNISSTIKDLNNSAQKVKGCKTRGSLGRKVKQNNIDCTSESTSHSDNFEPTSPSMLNFISLEHYNPTSKYNFCTPLDENLEADKRIQILQERLQDLRKTYLNIKSELATIERRRKKCKRKERSTPSSPGSQTENQKTNSPQSSTSSSTSNKDNHNHHLISTNNNLEIDSNKSTECNLNEQVC